MEIDSRVEEELSQRAYAHRAGNNNGDGDTVENRTSGPVKQRRGVDKSSTRYIRCNNWTIFFEETELAKERGLQQVEIMCNSKE